MRSNFSPNAVMRDLQLSGVPIACSRTLTFCWAGDSAFKMMLTFAAVWKGGDGEIQRQVTLRRNLSFVSKSVRGVSCTWRESSQLITIYSFWKDPSCFGVPLSVLEGYQNWVLCFQRRQHSIAFMHDISSVDVCIFENIIMTDMMTEVMNIWEFIYLNCGMKN